jgi:DNA-binding MarR family transcriptional regulator
MSNSKLDTRNRIQAVETTLSLLNVVAEDEAISQRGLAQHLGVALGLTNAVLKRCVKKGLLKIKQAPARRYVYYLTPQGFAEKSRLTAEYLSHSLNFYREARQEFTDLFKFCETRGWKRVVLVGATELAEIASLAAVGIDVEVVGVLDPERNEASLYNLPVYRSLDEIDPAIRPNAVIISEINDPIGAYQRLREVLAEERILAPRQLGISSKAKQAEPQE